MIIAKHIAIDTGMTYHIDASITPIMLITLYFITACGTPFAITTNTI